MNSFKVQPIDIESILHQFFEFTKIIGQHYTVIVSWFGLVWYGLVIPFDSHYHKIE